MFEVPLQFYWSLFPENKSASVRVMAWREQATPYGDISYFLENAGSSNGIYTHTFIDMYIFAHMHVASMQKVL